MTTEIEMAKNGEFLREYGKQYFIVASEALNIGRVKWNMVPIGKSGQGDIAFYLTTEQMFALCTEIINGEFAKKIDADKKNAYPKAYAYMTGEDGSLHLAIGGGNIGCLIQMRNLKTKPALNYKMAVSIEAMNTMARKYMMCTGAAPVMPCSYYASVLSAFETGRADRAKFRKTPPEDLTDVVDANNVVNEAVENEMKVDPPVERKEEEKAESVDNKAGRPDVSENFKLVIHGPKTIQKGFYVFAGTDENKNSISLMFRKEDAEKLNWFAKFENAAAVSDTPLAIRGEKRNNFILYKGPVKK